MKRSLVLAVLSAGLALSASMAAAQEIETFDSPNQTQTGNGDFAFANPIQGSWSSGNGGTIITNPTNVEVTINATAGHGYGTAYHNLLTQDNETLDISGSSTVQLDMTINSGDAGMFVDLQDGEGDNWQYSWGYGLTGTAADDQGGLPAGYTITQGADPNEIILDAPLASPTYDNGGTGVFDFTQLVLFRLEDDPGASLQNDTSFNDLSAISVPEPTSISFAAAAGLLALRRRKA